jgi:hypothetical protein
VCHNKASHSDIDKTQNVRDEKLVISAWTDLPQVAEKILDHFDIWSGKLG